MKGSTKCYDGELTVGNRAPNVEFVNVTVEQASADAATEVTIPTGNYTRPLEGKAFVWEVLGVFLDTGQNVNLSAVPASYTLNVRGSYQPLGAALGGVLNFSDSRIFFQNSKLYRSAFTAGGTFYQQQQEIEFTNLSDGAGHGHLVCSDNVSFSITSATGQVNGAYIKVMMRWKCISMSDFMAIAQTQKE